MDTERELLKGNTQTLIMAILRSNPLHGYAIAREIELRGQDGMRFKDGTLYPALQALERDGFIEGDWQSMQNAPARKVYRLTVQGESELVRRTEAWDRFVERINRILSPGRPQRQGE